MPNRPEIRAIVADNLPTFADLYDVPPTRLPSTYRLGHEAARIVEALEEAGYRIIRDDAFGANLLALKG